MKKPIHCGTLSPDMIYQEETTALRNLKRDLKVALRKLHNSYGTLIQDFDIEDHFNDMINNVTLQIEERQEEESNYEY